MKETKINAAAVLYTTNTGELGRFLLKALDTFDTSLDLLYRASLAVFN